jgi:hypothetical protein
MNQLFNNIAFSRFLQGKETTKFDYYLDLFCVIIFIILFSPLWVSYVLFFVACLYTGRLLKFIGERGLGL